MGIATYVLVWIGVDNLWFSWPSMTTEIIGINVLVTSGIYYWLFRASTPQLFINFYLLSIVMKLIFFSFLLLMIRWASPQVLMANATLVLCCYFTFTFLEVAVLFLKTRR